MVLGRPSVAEDGAFVADAALAMSEVWPKARFLPALRRGNVMGALDMGLSPGVLPGSASASTTAGRGSSRGGDRSRRRAAGTPPRCCALWRTSP